MLNFFHVNFMPIVNLQMTSGYSTAQKTALLKQATQAITESIGAPISSVRIAIQEIATNHVIVAGEIGKEMVLFTVSLITGRTEEKKAALILALNKAACAATGISSKDVRVMVRDVPNTDMGMADGVSAKAAGR
jgi:4-oxalocrotonate tautomerase